MSDTLIFAAIFFGATGLMVASALFDVFERWNRTRQMDRIRDEMRWYE